jgi:hypothetical protein
MSHAEPVRSPSPRIAISGTGTFASRILFDLAATAPQRVEVVLLGRRPDALAWMKTAALARAAMFGRTLQVDVVQTDFGTDDLARKLADARPSVVLQAASAQAASVIAGTETAWGRLVREGGLSASAVIQADVTSRVAKALQRTGSKAHFVNCCFPDVVNELVARRGLPLTCGVGNISILAHAFQGQLASGRVRLLAHYQDLAAWRRPPAERTGPQPRAWIDSDEVEDVFARFREVQLTPQPVIDISGASAVPVALALCGAMDIATHVPGPEGLPGGYPVRISGGALSLALPPGISQAEAVAWNRAHEESNGLVVTPDGHVEFTGRLRECLHAASPDLARGFALSQMDDALAAFLELRTRLSSS